MTSRDTLAPDLQDSAAAQSTEPASARPHAADDGFDWPGYVAQLVVGCGSLVALLTAFQPGMMLSSTLATGGDTGSHHYVTKAAEKFFPWSLYGWASGWYAGMPMLEFYFPLPYLAIWALSAFVGYPVAFKLVSVAGVFALPLVCWLLFRFMDAPRLAQAMAPAAAICFLWIEGKPGPPDTTSLDIFGGFITSTLAGEFSYSIGLSLTVLAVALLYRATRRADTRWPWGWMAVTALVIGLTAMTHLLPVPLLGYAAVVIVIGRLRRDWWPAGLAVSAFVLVIGMVVVLAYAFDGKFDGRFLVAGAPIVLVLAIGAGLSVVGVDWRRVVVVVACAALGVGIAATFMLPAFWYRGFTAGGRWINSYGVEWFAPAWFWWVIPLSFACVPVAIWKRRPGPLVLAWCALCALLAFYLMPDGQAVNGRFLPTYYLMMALLAAWCVGELFESIPLQAEWRWTWATLVVALAAGLAAVTYVPSQKVESWAKHNYTGYETKPAWPELQDLMRTIRDLPAGRVAWEYNADFERFGTPRAVENIPFFTDKDTMEGLLLESSVSARGHFWMQGEFSPAATGAVPGINYPTFDAGAAVRHLQMYACKFFVAESESVKRGIGAQPGVEEAATSGSFTVYEIPDAWMVRVPAYDPVYLEPGDRDWRDLVVAPNTEPLQGWLQDTLAQQVPVTFGALGTAHPGAAGTPLAELAKVETIAQVDSVRRRPVKGAGGVRDVVLTTTSIEFTTDRVGEPHIVAVSYFPNWHAEGADGPYLVTPSLMLVYPRQKHVKLTYGVGGAEAFGSIVSLLSLAATAGLGGLEWQRRRRRRGAPTRASADAPAPSAASLRGPTPRHVGTTGTTRTPRATAEPNAGSTGAGTTDAIAHGTRSGTAEAEDGEGDAAPDDGTASDETNDAPTGGDADE